MSFKAGDKVKCIDNAFARDYFVLGESYLIDSVPSTDHVGFDHSGRIAWCADRFELIEKEDTVSQPKQFNPQSGHNVVASLQPGDKIICNNGEEYTCCTLDYVRETISTSISSDKPLFGCNDDGWQDWNADGTTHFDDYDYRIREVVPKQDAIQEAYTPLHCPLQFSTAQGFMSLNKEENPVYTTEDIRKAVIDDLGWQGLSLDLIMKALDRVTNPEYNEYLRLKAMFESAETDEE